jgi:hypothetical protein
VAVTAIRILVLLLALIALGILLVPVLVLVDLVSGGTGYGLCAGGIENCQLPYSAGAEMLILLSIALFAVLMVIRGLMRLARRLQAQTRPYVGIPRELSTGPQGNTPERQAELS